MHDIPKAPYDGVAITPEKRVEMACMWIADDYPKKWLRLVNLCEWAKSRGIKRIRRGDLFVLASQRGMDISACEEFRFDNNLWSVLSRFLLMFRPSLADVIFPKEAAIDRAGIDFERAWHSQVCANTCFPEDSWQHASEFYRSAA